MPLNTPPSQRSHSDPEPHYGLLNQFPLVDIWVGSRLRGFIKWLLPKKNVPWREGSLSCKWQFSSSTVSRATIHRGQLWLPAPPVANPHAHTTLTNTVSSYHGATAFPLILQHFPSLSHRCILFKNSNINNSFGSWRRSSVVDGMQQMRFWDLSPASASLRTSTLFLQAANTCWAASMLMQALDSSAFLPASFPMHVTKSKFRLHARCALQTTCIVQLRWVQAFLS